MGMFDDLIPNAPANAQPGGMFDDLIPQNSTTKSGLKPRQDTPQWPPQLNQPEPTSPAERRFAEELKTKAAKMLVGDSASPMTAGMVAAANTYGLNLPRRGASYLRAFQTGNSPDSEYQRLKAEDEALAQLYPKSTVAGATVGALAQAPLFPGAAAESFAGRALQSATLGGVLGGSAEFVDTGSADQANKAAMTGALLGGGLSVGADALLGAGKLAGNTVTGAVNTFRGLRNPEAEAARRVTESLKSDFSSGQTRLTAPEWQRAVNEGQPVVIADVGGEATKNLARDAANISPEASAALKTVTNDRFGTQNTRLGALIEGWGSGRSAVETSDALAAAAKQANRPAYEAAYSHPNAQAVWSPELAQLMQAPAVQDAIKSTIKTGANKAAAQGFKPPANPFVKDTSGTFTLSANPDGSQAIPSIQFWDYVQRNLNDQIGKLTRDGKKGAASDATSLRNQLNGYLDSIVPEFKSARAGAAQFFGAQDALEAGQKFVKSPMSNAEGAKAMAKMSRPERVMLEEGFVSKLTDDVMASADRRNVINQIYNTPKARERLTMVLGPQRATELEGFLHVERIMDELRTAVSGNSSTARQLMQAGLAGGTAGALLGGDSGSASLGAFLGALTKRVKLGVDANVARKVGEMLASNDPQIVQKALKSVAKNKPLLNMLRKAQVSASGTLGASQ